MFLFKLGHLLNKSQKYIQCRSPSGDVSPVQHFKIPITDSMCQSATIYSHEWEWPVKRPYFRLYLLKRYYSLLDTSVKLCAAGNNVLRPQVAVFFVLFISGQRRHLCMWTVFIIELTRSTSTSTRNSKKKKSCFQVSFFWCSCKTNS